MKPETLDKVITLISRADKDELHQINDMVRATYSRHRAMDAAKALRNFQPGDFARLQNIRPKDMNGVKVRILSLRSTRFNVEVLPGQYTGRSRFAGSKTLIVAATCLTPCD